MPGPSDVEGNRRPPAPQLSRFANVSPQAKSRLPREQLRGAKSRETADLPHNSGRATRLRGVYPDAFCRDPGFQLVSPEIRVVGARGGVYPESRSFGTRETADLPDQSGRATTLRGVYPDAVCRDPDVQLVSGEFGWSGRRDLNSRPPAPKAGALPGCATPRCGDFSTKAQLHRHLRRRNVLVAGSFAGREGHFHQRASSDSRNAAISWPLRTSRTSPTSTGWFQVLPSITGNRASSVNWSGVAPTSASSPSSESTSSRS